MRDDDEDYDGDEDEDEDSLATKNASIKFT